MIMALSRNYHKYLSLTIVVTAIIFSSLTLLHPADSGGIEAPSLTSSRDNNEEVRSKMILGSRPPACVNKCLSCRPCEATLVIPPHHNIKIKDIINSNYEKSSSSSSSHIHNGHSHRGGDGSYYLLSWKCRCGNRLYQP